MIIITTRLTLVDNQDMKNLFYCKMGNFRQGQIGFSVIRNVMLHTPHGKIP